MKRITNLFAALCLCCCVSSAYATDYYISATGDDANNGLTKETPVKTLGKIHQFLTEDLSFAPEDPALPHHRIFVDGIIDMTNEVTSTTTDFQGGIGTKNGGLQGFFFKNENNWGRASFYGLNPLQEADVENPSDYGRKYLRPVDGFDAKGKSRVFAIDGGTHEFKNLLFTGGSDVCDDGGGAMWLRNTEATFKNCLFVKNYAPTVEVTVEGQTFYALSNGGSAPVGKRTNSQGGAMAILTTAGKGVAFEDCIFDDNMNRQGSALWISGGAVSIKNSIFTNNGKSPCYHMTATPAPKRDNHGGAIQLQNNHDDTLKVVIEDCFFYGNQAYGQGGAVRVSPAADKTSQVGQGKNPFVDVTIRNCIFNENYADEAGALMVHNESLHTKNAVRVFKSQFYGNASRNDAGAVKLFSAQPGDVYTMVNSSVIGNTTMGNGGHGAGLIIADRNKPNGEIHYRTNRVKYFYNNIFENNRALHQTDEPSSPSYNVPELGADFSFREDPTREGPLQPGEMDMDGNLIGRALGASIIADSWPFPAINEFSYYLGNVPEVDYINYPGYFDEAGMDEIYLNTFYVLPLKPDAYARTFGKAEYLNTYAITKDLMGYDYVINGDICTAGAVEVSSEELDGIDIPTWAWPLSTLTPGGDVAIPSTKVLPKGTLVVKGDALELANGSNAQIEVIGLSGAVVKTGSGSVSLANLPKGVYIAKAQVGGNVYIQKFIK